MTYCMNTNPRTRKNYEKIFASRPDYKIVGYKFLILLGFLVGRVGIEPTTR